MRHFTIVFCVLASAVLDGQQRPAGPSEHSPLNPEVPRAIRRDIPLTNSIRRAFDAGTRDRTGRPGA